MAEKQKIVIASDSFKGSLSCAEINEIWHNIARESGGTIEVVPLLVADGGDGTLDAVISAKNGKSVKCKAFDPLFRKINTRYGVFGDAAIISVSEVSGLALISESERDPLKTTSFGTGELIKQAIISGAKNVLVTLGGSATNDCGIGALTALGFKFVKKDGSPCRGIGEELEDIVSIDDTDTAYLNNVNFTLLCDVTNPLTGSFGAARVFARQKGADDKTIERLERGAINFKRVLGEKYGKNADETVGGGAAGGMGAGLAIVLGAKISSGIEEILNLIDFDEKIKTADYIVTGEGRIDFQSKDGKLISGILRHAKAQNKKVVAVVGSLGEGYEALLSEGLTAVFPMAKDKTEVSAAIAHARKYYERAAKTAYATFLKNT